MNEVAGDVRRGRVVLMTAAAARGGTGELQDAPLYQGTTVNPTWRWDGAARRGEERERAHHPERESAEGTIDQVSTARQESCRDGAMKLKTPVD
jgi:hypothetical protein